MTDEAPRVASRAALRLPPHNLPEALTSFVGRSRELTRLLRLLEEHRIVTILGPGGVGKSRLAIELARRELSRFVDGVWLVDLAGVTDSRLVIHSVAAVVGIAHGPMRSLSTALSEILRPRRLLLILDNCEHIIDPCAELAALLTRECPSLRILATSREPIGIDGEQLMPLEPLSTLPAGHLNARRLRATDAARLFSERVRGIRPEFELTESVAEPVAEICRRLDGLPLALELAAARLRTMTVQELASGLDQRFELLTTGSRAAHPRHRTLLGMVEWSTVLLEDSESKLLRRLAVFAGGWTREAAVAVCQDQTLPASVIPAALDLLVDRSLVVLDDWRGTSRYRLLDTMRAFATERLIQAGEESALRRRHQDRFLTMLLRSRADMVVDQLDWFARMDSEIENLRTAFDWCVAEPSTVERALYATWGLWVHSEVRGRAQELVHRYDQLLALVPPGAYSGAQLLAESLCCHALGQLGEIGRAVGLLTEMAQRAPTVHDPWAHVFYTLINLQLKIFVQDPDAIQYARDAVERDAREQSSYPGVWPWFLGEALVRFGQLEEAHAVLSEALAVLPLRRERAFIVRGLGVLAFYSNQLQEAEDRFRESLATLVPFVDIRNLAIGIEELACVSAHDRRAERAARLLGASEMLFDLVSTVPPPWTQIGPKDAAARCRADLGEARFEAAFAEGRAMTVDRALAYALEPESASTGPAGPDLGGPLSQRELEVARLIAQGFSNRRIAETLVISQKTVESHVSHALTKLGLHSRASLAVWTARQKS